MSILPARRASLAIVCALTTGAAVQAADPDKKAKPSISVKVTPTMGFSPARMVVTADLKDGADDYEEFYCASVEWDWGDDTRSESKTDCEPYEAGKSQIKRHFTVDHTYNTGGEYRIEFRLKQKNKVVGRGTADVKIRPGVRDPGFDRFD
jgi:plastocyanin